MFHLLPTQEMNTDLKTCHAKNVLIFLLGYIVQYNVYVLLIKVNSLWRYINC